jgi:hypothetical protein
VSLPEKPPARPHISGITAMTVPAGAVEKAAEKMSTSLKISFP